MWPVHCAAPIGVPTASLTHVGWQYIGMSGFHGKLPLHVDGDIETEMDRIRQLLLSRSDEPLELDVEIEAERTRIVVNPSRIAWWYLSKTS